MTNHLFDGLFVDNAASLFIDPSSFSDNDKNGIIWPISIAPFEVIITPVNKDDADVVRVAEDLYTELTAESEIQLIYPADLVVTSNYQEVSQSEFPQGKQVILRESQV